MSETFKAMEDPIETYEHILEHEDKDTQTVAVGIDRMVKGVGHVVMWANVLLIAAIVAQVLFRYLLNQNFPKLDEIQWHFYGLVTMVGISYALVTDSHVRVDILHLQLSRRAQRIIEVLGILTLVAPFLYLMVDQGVGLLLRKLARERAVVFADGSACALGVQGDHPDLVCAAVLRGFGPADP